MTRYRRRTLDWWEEAAAVAAGLAMGMAAGYLTRLWLGRAPLEEPPYGSSGPGEEARASGGEGRRPEPGARMGEAAGPDARTRGPGR